MSFKDLLKAFAKSQGLASAEELSRDPKYTYMVNARRLVQPTVDSLASRLPSGLEGQKVLHIGAGYGSLAIELAKRGASVVGIENAEPKRALAEVHAKGEADVTFLKSYVSVRSHVAALREHGPFSVIIAHEIFRRTYDVLGLLDSLKSLGTDDCVLNYRITNFFTPNAVMGDPVKRKLGLVLLPPDKVFEYVGEKYSVYFRRKAYYDALFEHVGFSDEQSLTLNTDPSYEQTRKVIDAELRRIRGELKEEEFKDSKISSVVKTACREYLDEAAWDIQNADWSGLFEKYRAAHWEGMRTLEKKS